MISIETKKFILFFFILTGVSPNLCCDRNQLTELRQRTEILDNVIGRCPSCYYNFLRVLCEMACSPEQDQFIWPLELINITRSNVIQTSENKEEGQVHSDWALQDYVDPEEENQEEEEEEEEKSAEESKPVKTTQPPPPPVDTVEVVQKVRYYMSEKAAQTFFDSCW